MENTEMSYEVRYLLNGEEHTIALETTSAAAASETVRNQVTGDGDDFELIQVLMMEDASEEPQAE